MADLASQVETKTQGRAEDTGVHTHSQTAELTKETATHKQKDRKNNSNDYQTLPNEIALHAKPTTKN